MGAEILAEMSWAFAGRPPDVPLSSELEVEEWRNGDEGANKPMFVTLPLLKVGVKSHNGVLWDKPAALRVVQEINAKRPDGNLGHLPKEKRSTDYNLPVLRWLGAMLDEQTGLVWGKAYVPKYAQDVREFLADAKRARARVGTSVYGVQGNRGLLDMSLESVDLGHADRVAHPDAAAVPHLTSEMKDEQADKGGEKNPMETEMKLVSELTTQKDNALRQVSEMTTKLSEKDNLIAEMKSKVEVLARLETLVAEFAGATVIEKLDKLVAEVRDLRQKNQLARINDWIAEAIKAVELEDLRPTIGREMTLLAEMGKIDSAETAKKLVTEIQGREDIKLIAESLRDKLAGPAAFVGGRERGDNPFKDLNKPESIAAARAATGI